MPANKTDEGARKTHVSRYAAALSFLVLTALGIMLWGSRDVNIASLGLAWVVLVASSYLFATKYLGERMNGAAGREWAADGREDFEKASDVIADNLPGGYLLIHGFYSIKGRIDHILICPKGIFTLETDGHAGEVTFDGQKLLRNGRPFERDFLKQAWSRCSLVRDLLAGWGIATPLPEPVILFRNATVNVRGKAGGVEIAGIGNFPKLLGHLPDRLTATEADKIFNRIQAASVL